MDDRVREHATVLVEWSARIDPGDHVVLAVDEGAHDLAVAVAEELGRVGATVVPTYASEEVTGAYLASHDGDFDAAAPERALLEEADAHLALGGGWNTMATADVPGETRGAYRRARQGIREARLATDWVRTIHPTRSLAQQAGMAVEPYRAFVYDAILRDWESLAAEMARVKERLDAASEARLVVDRPDRPRTDLAMSITDGIAVNSAASVAYDSHNLPSGEVFTAPDPTTAEGEVCFDVPLTVDGRRVRDVQLTFRGGEVVEYAAAQGEDALESVLETDDGARRLGELGIGMNRGIDRFTDNVLFDEKMAETVHLALGRTYETTLPDGVAGNDSAVHVDLIVDVSRDARLELDGEVVQRNGTFWYEESFDAASREDTAG